MAVFIVIFSNGIGGRIKTSTNHKRREMFPKTRFYLFF